MSNTPSDTKTATLGFTIENRAGIDVLVWEAGGCQPATSAEIAMWKALSAAPQPVAREPLSAEQYNILVEDLSEWSRHVEVDTAPRSLEEHIHQVFAIHGIKGGQHGTE